MNGNKNVCEILMNIHGIIDDFYYLKVLLK